MLRAVGTRIFVEALIFNTLATYGDLLATVKRQKRKWYGHVTRSDGLTKVILQRTIKVERRRGEQAEEEVG